MKQFDAVVTLGGWCRVTYQARTHFRYKTAYPFDWLICPTPSLRLMLQDRFSGLLHEEKLILRHDLDGVTCLNYGIQHKHDFLRDQNHLTLPLFTSQIPSVREKFFYRVKNFLALKETGSVLFIRLDEPDVFRSHDEDSDYSGSPASLADAKMIYQRLTDLFPDTSIQLLCLNFNVITGSVGNIIFDRIVDYKDYEPEDYRGSTMGWSEMFGRYGFRLKGAQDDAINYRYVSSEIDVPAGYF